MSVSQNMKRKILQYIVIIQLFIGVLFFLTPFFQSMKPPQYKVDEQNRIYNSTLNVDLTSLRKGELMTVEWQGVPIGIYRRTDIDIINLSKLEAYIHDPASNKQLEIPSWWKKMSVDKKSKFLTTDIRSRSEDFFVFNRVSPIYGCMVTHISKENAESNGFSKNWLGGFFDPCQKVAYDLSGRIFKGQGHGLHLLIPPYKIRKKWTLELIPNG